MKRAQTPGIPDQSDSVNGNLVARLARVASENGWLDRPAYIVHGKTYRYQDVYEGAGRAAAAFVNRGLGVGDRVLLALPDGIDLVWSFLGALRAGIVAIPVNSDLHPDELRRAAEIAEPDAVVCELELAACFPYPLITPGRLRSETTVLPHAECTPDTPGFALFTSGTTGDPKLCFHTHGDPDVYDQSIGSVVEVTPDDVCLSVSRLYFSYGLGNSIFLPLLRGGTTVLSPKRATEETALSLIRDHGVTVFYGQPSFFARLLSHPDHGLLSGLRLAVCAGEVLPDALERKLRRVLGHRLLNVFGTTEIGHAIVANSTTDHRDFTVGRLLAPYRMQILNELGEVVPPGVEGLLEVAGPTIGLGVARGSDSPLRTGDSWYRTGDVATVDEDGFLRIHGRADDIEIVAGANVHPTEIEDLLMTHPAVVEAAVCSARNDAGVSALRAFVVLGGDADPDAVRTELTTTAEQALTWYKVPADIVFVCALPRNPTGKLLRREVRAMVAKSEQDGL
ncbi:class I adenylate-forming enzyme family protein [Saccharopolyspora phatthalungensis]|uniref:Fatty acid CoA ligase FadD22 n=1 Tax=Saccharopolyspora phatthalungensis TaxID=664693 RepID=A0A840QFJ5_9PSEU|nr:class I adenylate-forming enzyme family protein [Saccharopolyspora phatthalungensis]MBB5159604.1 fatty acid CoA ligase FadD22 [Saccharopolyspora phatthalungensis]